VFNAGVIFQSFCLNFVTSLKHIRLRAGGRDWRFFPVDRFTDGGQGRVCNKIAKILASR
jgi:hypothetical protein